MTGYKIRDLEVLTGIKAHTIRMWEKRYGLLNPKRTNTQIRTYSDDELLLLLNVSLLHKNGYKISHIAQMDPEELLKISKSIQESGFENSAAEQLIVSVLQLNEHLFQQVFKDLVEKTAYRQFTQTSLFLFAKNWCYVDSWDNHPAQEHFISNLIRQKIMAAIDALPIPDFSQKRIILYLPEHEWHEISLLVYHYHLRSKGFYSIYLGQSVPFDALLKTIRQLKPDAIVSSWLTGVDQQQILAHFHQLQNELKEIKIAAGGYQIGQLKSRLPKPIKHIHSLAELEKII